MREDICPYCGVPLILVQTPSGTSTLHDFPVCQSWWKAGRPGANVDLDTSWVRRPWGVRVA